jgi:protein ImuB
VSYAVLHAADFALQAVVRTEADLDGKPAALLEDRARKAVIVQANASARAAGVQVGLIATQAMARCADIVLRARSAAAEKESEAGLLAVAWSLSPRVERTAAGICTIDLAGKAADTHLPHSREAVERLRLLGLETTAGVARTPLLALYAARLARPALEVKDERGFLSPLPLSLVDPPPDLAAILEGWGLRTLGALTALPKPEIGRRLGQAGVDLWERAAGETDRPIDPCAPGESFTAAMELEHEVETLEPLLFILRRFVDRLALQLANAHRVAAELALELQLVDETRHQRGFRLPEPTGDADILFRALHTHLETLRTAAAIRGVGLVVTPARPLERQHGLFDTGLRDPHGFAETLARVGAVVGADRVGTPWLELTHRPDAFSLAKPADVVAPVPAPSLLPPLGLPLRRFRPPVEARVETGPQGPAFLRCRLVQGPVRQRRGPWRRSGEWWKSGCWNGEEWDVELENGGLFRLTRRARQWWIEGMYD